MQLRRHGRTRYPYARPVRRLLLLIYALIFVDEMVLFALVPLVPSYRDDLDLSGFESGLLLSVASFALVVGSIPSGLAGDRLGARRVTLAGGALLVVSCFGQAVAPELWTLLAARVLFGLASAVVWSAGLSWLADSAGDARPGALGAVVAVAGLGSMVGPAFAGVMADRVSRGAAFAALGVAAAVVVAVLAGADPGHERAHEHHRLSRITGLARRDALIAGGVVGMLLGGFSDGVVNLIGPAQLDDAGRSTTWIGIVLSLAAALFILFSAMAARRAAAVVSLRVAAICAGLSVLVLIPVLISGAVAAVVVTMLAREVPLGVLYAISLPLGVRGARRLGIGAGAVNGLLSVAWGGASFAGAIAAGSLAEAAGADATYAVLAACAALACAGFVMLDRRSV